MRPIARAIPTAESKPTRARPCLSRKTPIETRAPRSWHDVLPQRAIALGPPRCSPTHNHQAHWWRRQALVGGGSGGALRPHRDRRRRVTSLHPWNATFDGVERADTVVIDLDPGPGVEWSFIVDTALTLRELLHQGSFECWPKLTVGKGIHVMIPFEASISDDASHRRSREIAEHLARLDPGRHRSEAASPTTLDMHLANSRARTCLALSAHPFAKLVSIASQVPSTGDACQSTAYDDDLHFPPVDGPCRTRLDKL